MELTGFIEKFVDLFEDVEIADIQPDTLFKELDEWDSLTALSVIALAKTEFNKDINGREIRSCETVEDLYHLIMSK